MMEILMKNSILFCAALLMSGCYKTNLVNFSDSGSPGREVVVWQHNLLVGLVPLTEVDIQNACGDAGAFSIQTKQSFVQVLLTSFTSAIYTPTSAVIVCKG
jgi:hypothetical protein